MDKQQTNFRQVLWRFWEQLPAGQRPVRVAVLVSGGADSMALADMLRRWRKELGLQLALLHLNYGLRPEAETETALVKDWSRRHDLPLLVQRVKLADQGNRQAQARAARFAAAQALLADGLQPAAAVLGHHADDQAETLLLHLLRGSGLAGMHGLRPTARQANLLLLRPLLTLTHAQLKDYCVGNGVPYAEDSSNAESHYRRNLLRHNFPVLAGEVNPEWRAHLLNFAKVAAGADELLQQRMRGQAAAGRGRGYTYIDRRLLTKYHSVERYYWWQEAFAMLGGWLLTAARFAELEKFLFSGAHCWQGCQQLAAEQWRGRVYLHALPLPAAKAVTVRLQGCERIADWGLTMTSADPGDWPAELPEHAAVFAAAQLRGPFVLRGRQPGDRFRPAGMDGHTCKLKEFLPACGIPRFLRDRVPLLTDEGRGGAIIWVVGQRLAQDAAGSRSGGQLKLVTVREGV